MSHSVPINQLAQKQGYLQASAVLRGMTVLFALLYLSPSLGQQAFLYPLQQLENKLTPPTFAEISQPIGLDAAQLNDIRLGAHLSLQISETRQIQLQVMMMDRYVNGDYVVGAEGRDGDRFFSLTITHGQRSLFGHLSSDDEAFQIYGIANADDGHYQGWIYKPGNLVETGQDFQNDYIILDKPKQKTAPQILSVLPATAPVLPLQLDGALAPSSSVPKAESADAVSTPEINTGNFRVSQNFSSRSVLVGNTFDVSVEFENIGSQPHNDLYVEFYFVLENSELMSAPSECREQLSLSLQKTLYCELGDFVAGEKKSFIYSLVTDERAKPRVISSLVIGDMRLDGYVNVVEDIRLDTDGDGISDFNEMLLATDALDSSSVDIGNSVIDILALYTPGAASLYPYGVQTRINQLISVANQIYADSGVKITLRPVYHGLVDYSDSNDMGTALSDLIAKTDSAFGNVDSLRTAYGADLVMMFRPSQAGEGRCGLAPVGGFGTNGDLSSPSEKEFAYSLVAVDCPVDLVAAHELGHNMGLSHSHLEDGSGGTFNFSTGYGVEGQFVTVMAYPAAFNTQTRVSVFSNPLTDCLGFACGLDSEYEFGADAVQSLNLVRHQIANYFSTQVPDLPGTTISTLSGKVSAATISIAASRDGGLSFSNSVSHSDSVSLEAVVEVDPRDIGDRGGLYVLVGLKGQGLYQLNQQGEPEEWDSTVEGLIAFGGKRSLRKLEHLTIIDGFRFGSAFSNQLLLVYVAYWVESSGELVYTREPFELSID
ncbi:MAG: zinc-dependent metalloprotease family protein [Gammaproteobacteria bacterium]|nr:zinc-dependent metalloprotease family protein [Gammaproteobacteria bacterium]MDG2337520.1 zinc-dependent metalloprotease family protein [Gammaproteobacteria bacterium]